MQILTKKNDQAELLLNIKEAKAIQLILATCPFFHLQGVPCVCTHTNTEGEQRKASVRNILKSSGKNTIFNEHPVAWEPLVPNSHPSF